MRDETYYTIADAEQTTVMQDRHAALTCWATGAWTPAPRPAKPSSWYQLLIPADEMRPMSSPTRKADHRHARPTRGTSLTVTKGVNDC